MRLLLVEDDPRIAEPTAAALREAGYAVTWAQTGPEGLEAAMLGEFPLVVLDVMLPGLDGFEIAGQLREAEVDSPILFLTARGEVSDRVQGLDLGGDAYLVKPFELPELLAVLRAVVRRRAAMCSARIEFAGGQGRLDTSGRQVWWQGELTGLTAREYALLEALTLSRERWFTREELLTKVWGPEFSGDMRVVDVYVSYLRRKLAPEAVQSSRGLGYRVP